MPLNSVAPFEANSDQPTFDTASKSQRGVGPFMADAAYILIKASVFLASIYIGVLGLPLIFFLAVTGGDMALFFAQLGNLSAHFLDADAAARADFLIQVRLGLFGIATLIALWRLPTFLADISRTLHPKGMDQ